MGLNDLIKRTKLKGELSKYKLNNDQIEEALSLYDYVIAYFLDNFSEELKTNKDISRARIDSKIIEDITRIVYLNKSFIINDVTMEYIINKKNSFTILQFLNNFHYLSQTTNENTNFYYNLSNFIKYVVNRAFDEKEYAKMVMKNESINKIAIDYLNSVKELKAVEDTQGAIDMYNYLVGYIWYNELVKEYPDIITDICEYLINHYDEIKEQIEEDSTMSDTGFDDNMEAVINAYINKKVKKLD